VYISVTVLDRNRNSDPDTVYKLVSVALESPMKSRPGSHTNNPLLQPLIASSQLSHTSSPCQLSRQRKIHNQSSPGPIPKDKGRVPNRCPNQPHRRVIEITSSRIPLDLTRRHRANATVHKARGRRQPPCAFTIRRPGNAGTGNGPGSGNNVTKNIELERRAA